MVGCQDKAAMVELEAWDEEDTLTMMMRLGMELTPKKD